MVGIFSNSSVNMIVNGLFAFYFFWRKNYRLMSIAFVLCLMTTYMSGVVILFLVVAYFVLTSDRIKIAHRISLVILSVLLFFAFAYISPRNVGYAQYQLTKIATKEKPRKVVSFIQTWDYLTENPRNFVFGAGMGNFSSRLAFASAGGYAKWYPLKFLHRSKEFGINHYSLWNSDVIRDRTKQGTANQPFSIYNQMLGEYGLLGFGIFVVFYFGVFFRNYSRLTLGRMLLPLAVGFFFLDYWFEYFSVTIILEAMILLDLKLAKKAEAAPEISKT
jgi:hypothetical protein